MTWTETQEERDANTVRDVLDDWRARLLAAGVSEAVIARQHERAKQAVDEQCERTRQALDDLDEAANEDCDRDHVEDILDCVHVDGCPCVVPAGTPPRLVKAEDLGA